MDNLVDMARAALRGDTVSRMSSSLNESESSIRQGFEEAVPLSIAGLANQASNEDAASSLLDSFRSGRYPHLDAGELGRAAAEPGATDRVVEASAPFLGQAFGGRLDDVVDGLAGETGLRRSTASTLLGLATPLVMGLVGKLALARNLDPRGLLGFLGEQRRFAAGALPAGLAGTLGPVMGPVGDWDERARPSRMVEIPHQRARRSLWPWLLGAVALLALVMWGTARRRGQQEIARAPAVTAPAVETPPAAPAQQPAQAETTAPEAPATTPAAPEAPMPPAETLTAGNGLMAFNSALDGTDPLPRRFQLPGLLFRTDSAEIDPGSAEVLDQVGDALKAHPSAKVRVEGHTDSTGQAGANQQLATDRANATRDYLVTRGVPADRVEAAGFGAERPVAANDTAENRAENRRIELVLVER
jgi:OmpA-OmpF porin, OOP family